MGWSNLGDNLFEFYLIQEKKQNFYIIYYNMCLRPGLHYFTTLLFLSLRVLETGYDSSTEMTCWEERCEESYA